MVIYTVSLTATMAGFHETILDFMEYDLRR